MSLILDIGTFYVEFGSWSAKLCSTKISKILITKIMQDQATRVLDIRKLSSKYLK